jgi:hypothetical protein
MSDTITLRLTATQLDSYCRELRRISRNPGQAVTALVSLQTFLSAMSGPDVQADAAYADVRAVLEAHLSDAQDALLRESAAALVPAIIARNQREIARVHGALSRSGFSTALADALDSLDDAALADACRWAGEWCRDARLRAEEASGYPEAFDFVKAGISVEEYAAMADLEREMT